MKLDELDTYQEMLDDVIEHRQWRSKAEAKLKGISFIASHSLTYSGSEDGTVCLDVAV